MSLGQETQKYNSAGPNIYCTSLLRIIEKSLRGHVALSTSPVLNLHLLLHLYNFLHSFILRQLFRSTILIYFNFRKSKINKQASVGLGIIKKIGRLDISVDNSIVRQVFDWFHQGIHISSYIIKIKSCQISQKRLALLIFEN